MTTLNFAYFWAAQFAFAALLTSPFVVFGWQRARWQVWEVLGFVLPFGIWFGLMAYGHRPKSLSNLGEALNLIIAVPIAAALRVILGKRVQPRIAAVATQAALCLVAVGTYFLTPELPE